MIARRVDYDLVAPSYDRRYRDEDYSGVSETLDRFVGRQDSRRVLEVGCGTGHWLAHLAGRGALVAGIDPSEGMLQRARVAVSTASVALGRAECLPWPAASFDRVFCINAFHHFGDKLAFVREACRVLGSGGGLLTVGLDPHAGTDRWWIYDYFPEAWEIDKARYLPTEEIREMMAAAGFSRCETEQAQHLPIEMSAEEALDKGMLHRNWTSQLTVLTDKEYERGVARILTDMEASLERDEPLMLSSDLRLWATTAWLPEGRSHLVLGL